MEITFIGHSAFVLKTTKHTIMIDPFLTDNPANSFALDYFKPDLILVTHGHSDHLGDALEISKQTGGLIVSNVEIAKYCSHHGAKAHGMNIGGTHKFGEVSVKLTMAVHSSSIGQCPAQYLGNPAGLLIKTENLTIYHSGDTALFGDMELIGRLHPIDIAMLPIGDNFTMGPEEALEAVKLLQPKHVIPMHYNTWSLVEQDANAFKLLVEQTTNAQVTVQDPGTTLKTESLF